MKRLMISIGNEFYKLAIKKKYIVFLAAAVAVSFVRIGGSALISKISAGSVEVSVGNIPMTMLLLFAEILVPLIVFMAMTDLIATEFSEGTMKASLLLPQSRMKVLTSKIAAAFLMGACYYIILLAACFLIEAAYGGAVGSHFVQTVGAYLIDLIPMLVLTIMAAMINLAAKGSTFSMFLCILVYAVMKYMNYFVSGIGDMLFTSYLQWHRLWIGETLPLGALIPKIGILLGSGVLMYGVSYYLMDKKEL